MTYYLSIGSNQGDRLQHLQLALRELKKLGTILQCSPLFENPPLLPEDSPQSWYRFFLNGVITLSSQLEPIELLPELQKVERLSGRKGDHQKWSPRTLDIDILFTDPETQIVSKELRLPHPEITNRNFVLSPLTHLNPTHYMLGSSVIERSREQYPLSALMGIVNITPDSFSESSGKINYDLICNKVETYFKSGLQYIDLGAESTRPGAVCLSAKQEWERLQPVLEHIRRLKQESPFTKVSVDTYHPETARRCLDYSVDILNDVNGLQDPAMIEAAAHFESLVVMHSLSIPANKEIILNQSLEPLDVIKSWMIETIERLPSISAQKIIFDPGIGFGKTPLQSTSILQNIDELLDSPFRILVGHSRKSFMNLWCDEKFSEREPETLGASMYLQQRGVDILRVHDVDLHQRAIKSFLALGAPL